MRPPKSLSLVQQKRRPPPLGPVRPPGRRGASHRALQSLPWSSISSRKSSSHEGSSHCLERTMVRHKEAPWQECSFSSKGQWARGWGAGKLRLPLTPQCAAAGPTAHSRARGGPPTGCIPRASLVTVRAKHVPALGALHLLLPFLRICFLKCPRGLLPR